MAIAPQFLIRELESSDLDGAFVISAFDAALPFLASIGSSEQWGSIPFSRREGWIEETMLQLKDSEHSHLAGESNGKGLHTFIAERECHEQSVGITDAHYRTAVDGRRFLSVGFAFVREDWIPSYIISHPHLHMGDSEHKNILYLELMITDSRVGSLRCGAGAALIHAIRGYGCSKAKKALYLDGWAGNDRKLIKYYAQQGFNAVDDFNLPRADKAPWCGTLMQIYL